MKWLRWLLELLFGPRKPKYPTVATDNSVVFLGHDGMWVLKDGETRKIST